MALRPGATWQERYRGTNAIGTALTDDRAVVVHAYEHYLERNGFLACAAAPIHDPSGRLLGALDVSGDQRGYHRHTLGLVRSAAQIIEHRLFDTRHDLRQWGGLRLRFHAQPEGLGTVTEGLLAVREDGLLAGANSTALDLLGLCWQDLAKTRLDSVLAESLVQLLDWCRRSSYIPRVVHTASGQAVWVRVEAGRLAHLPLRDPMAAAAIPVATPEAVDALAALDTMRCCRPPSREPARPWASRLRLLLQGGPAWAKSCLRVPCTTAGRAVPSLLWPSTARPCLKT